MNELVTIQLKTIEQQVLEFLTKLGVTGEITPLRLEKKKWPGDTKEPKLPMFYCQFTFSRKGNSETFDYWYGVGHLVFGKRTKPSIHHINVEECVNRTEKEKLISKKPIELMSVSLRRPIFLNVHPASILHSLVLESQAGSETFEEWCWNVGCNEDSISALETYRACQKHLNKLRNIFSQKEIDQLAEILDEY